MESPREQPDLRSLLRALWRRKFLFLGILLTIPIVVYVISTQIPKTFEATTLLRIKAPTIDLSTLAPGTISTLETEALLAETEQVAKEAAKELGLPPSGAASLRGSVRVEPVSAASGGVTELIQLTASAEQGPRAAEIANAYAKALDTVRSRQALRQIDRTIVNLQQQEIKASDVITLDERSRQLQALRAARAGAEENTETIQPAIAPEYPISPHPRRNAALAAFVSLLLALGAVSLVERVDRRLRDSDELEPLLGAPLLSVIPSGAFPGAKPSPGPVREA
ncbi:MAG: hypothetical protein M3383_02970, partial [Actinomycetota bacterium]|nr:hypothetical protein [Actinomycetota bacterium]